MSQSLSSLLTHLIFSTKNRDTTIDHNIKQELEAYLASIFRSNDSKTLNIYANADHVHVLFVLSKNMALCEIIEKVKSNSSKWMKTKSAALKDFRWQSGYGAFSVSESNSATVSKYIANQGEHHKKIGFQEEFRKFLIKHKIPFDERYVWD